jgi:glycosyltransferase involved in cell wall biosynthesis
MTGASRTAGGGASPPTRPLRILHTLAPAPVGGLETVVHQLAIGQHRRGHTVQVLAFVDPGPEHPFELPLRAAGVDVVMCRLPGRAYVRTWRAAAEQVRQFQPDVVHSHGYRSDLLDAETARQRGIPTVTTVHGSSFLGGASRFFERLQLWCLRRFGAVISVSRPLTETLVQAGIPRDRIREIPNAWSGMHPELDRAGARAALGLPVQGPPVIGGVGRLIPIKDASLLLEALQRIADLEWQAILVGDGPERGNLEQQIEGTPIQDRVLFAGGRDRAGDLFPAFDLYVLSSRSEGTPMVLFEAMAAHVPVVATAVGGVPDVMGPQGALLTPPRDPEALAGALRASLMDPAAAQARAAAAHSRLTAVYSPARWLDQHDSVYRKLIPGG